MKGKTFDQHWDEIKECFDFKKVKRIMDVLKWGWHNEGVPDLEKIVKLAKDHCKYVYERNGGSIASGGLHASYDAKHDSLELSFILTDWATNGY